MPEKLLQPPSQKMPPEADLLFCTARVRMTPEIADRIRAAVQDDINWIYLVQLAMQHETTALLYWNLQRICPQSVPPGILEPLAARYKDQEAEARHRAEELVRILRALEDQGIFAVAYKGPILAQRLYGNLSLREFSEFSDLDIMINKRDLPKAQAVIQSQGYRLSFMQASNLRKYAWIYRELHFFRERDGERMLELHWRFMLRSARISGDPNRFLQRCESVVLSGVTVRSLPLEVYFLVLSLHATKHKWGKLKLICDIAEILGSPDVDWDYVVREAEDLGLKRMLGMGILLAQDPLEAAAPAGLMNRLKIDRTTRLLAAECRRQLLREPDEAWPEDAEYKFLCEIRERLQDRARMFLWNRLLPKITPVSVRPALRMAWEKITERS